MTCAVYFNLDGTLTRHDIDFEAVYAAAIDAADLASLDDAYQTYTDAFFSYFQDGWAYPRRQAILDVMQSNDITDTGQSDAFAAAWEDEEARRTEPFDGAADVVRAVADRHQAGIATNGTGRLQRMKLTGLGLDDLDAVLISSELGAVKPNEAFFDRATQALQADTYIIVSSDIRRDLAPAKQHGFRTVLVSGKDLDDRVAKIVDRQVGSLADVPDAVDDLCG